MINWDDPDYKAAGQFYALVKSVAIKCTNAQPVSASSNITSYVYGGNRSDAAPTIIYSNRTSLLNAAGRISPGVGSWGSAMLGLGLGVFLGLNALLL
jgi:hypothetical protein